MHPYRQYKKIYFFHTYIPIPVFESGAYLETWEGL